MNDIIQSIAHQLMPRYHDQTLCEQYAWWMVQAVTEKSKSELLTDFDVELTEEQDQQITLWIAQQVDTGVPLQYLLGSVPFGNLDILVESPTLIPRPETEEWVLHLVDQIRNVQAHNLTMLDMCTGSGCIALCLADAFSDAHIYACDIAPEAVALARKNAERAQIENVTILKSDLFTTLPRNVKFDIIATNPPYIAEKVWKNLDESVKEWEDKRALVAEDEGLALIKKIIAQAPLYLNKARPDLPSLIIEIGYDQGDAVAKLLEDAGFIDICIEHDMAGKDRVVSGRLI